MKKSPSALELDWPAEHQHVVFRELGWHYSRQGRTQLAVVNLTKATEANPYAVDCHYRRAVAQLQDLRLDAGLGSCRQGLAAAGALTEDPLEDFSCAFLEGRILFERGDFEEHMKVSVNRRELYTGHRRDDLEKELRIAKGNYENMLGRNAGNCLNGLTKYIAKVSTKDGERDVPRGYRRNPGDCDVVSLIEEQIADSHILQKKKIEKDTRMLGQLCLGRTWKDLEFLQSLRERSIWGKVVRLPETRETSKQLSDTVEECYRKVSTSLYQLQSRTPVYTHRNKQFQSKTQFEDYNTDNIFKLRYKTYREVYKQLDRMHTMRNQRDLPQLLKFSEETLWNYYQIKTSQIFPERYKFTTEVCNLVGLTILDQLEVPSTLMDQPLQDRLRLLLDLPPLHEHLVLTPVFGDKSTYRDPGAPDYRYIRYRNRCLALQQHLRYSRYPIERAMLYHALVRAHMDEEHLDTARIMIGRMLQEATQAGSNLWYFLGTLKLVETDYVQRNVERMSRSLLEAEQAVAKLDDERLAYVVHLARIINDEMLCEKLKQSKST